MKVGCCFNSAYGRRDGTANLSLRALKEMEDIEVVYIPSPCTEEVPKCDAYIYIAEIRFDCTPYKPYGPPHIESYDGLNLTQKKDVHFYKKTSLSLTQILSHHGEYSLALIRVPYDRD